MFNCLNSGQPVCFFSLSLLFTPSILVLFFPLGNELKLVLELAVVYSGRKLKKLDEIRLGFLELPLMCLFIHLRKIRLKKRMGMFVT